MSDRKMTLPHMPSDPKYLNKSNVGLTWINDTDDKVRVYKNSGVAELLDNTDLQQILSKIQTPELAHLGNNLEEIIRTLHGLITTKIPEIVNGLRKLPQYNNPQINILNGKYNPYCTYRAHYVIEKSNFDTSSLSYDKDDKSVKVLLTKEWKLLKLSKSGQEFIELDEDDTILYTRSHRIKGLQDIGSKNYNYYYTKDNRGEKIEDDTYIMVQEDSHIYTVRNNKAFRILRFQPWVWDNYEEQLAAVRTPAEIQETMSNRIKSLEEEIKELKTAQIKVHQTGQLKIFREIDIKHDLNCDTCLVVIYYDSGDKPGALCKSNWDYTIINPNKIRLRGLIGNFWVTIIAT